MPLQKDVLLSIFLHKNSWFEGTKKLSGAFHIESVGREYYVVYVSLNFNVGPVSSTLQAKNPHPADAYPSDTGAKIFAVIFGWKYNRHFDPDIVRSVRSKGASRR